jgi:hypothetical protein
MQDIAQGGIHPREKHITPHPAYFRMVLPVPEIVPGIVSPAFRKLPSSRLTMPVPIPPVIMVFKMRIADIFGKTIDII